MCYHYLSLAVSDESLQLLLIALGQSIFTLDIERSAHRFDSVQSILRSISRDHVQSQFDIVGNLPIEILCLIFRDVDTYQVFQLRRVSKTWRTKLCAPQLVESNLRPWFAMGEINVRMPDGIFTDEALAIKAEHVDAFKTGNPFSMALGNWDLDRRDRAKATDGPRYLVYCHGRLAWIDSVFELVRVRNLESGQETVYRPPNGELICTICLSRNILASTTSARRCYVWDCATGASYTVQLAPELVHNLFACNNSLAIVQGADDPYWFNITTWNLDSRQTRSFPIRLQRESTSEEEWDEFFEIRVTSDSLLLFEPQMGPPDEILFTRFTLDGRIMAQGSSGLLHRTFRSGYLHTVILPQQESTVSLFWRELDRFKIDGAPVELDLLRQKIVNETRGIVRIVYDLRNDQIGSLSIPCKHFEVGQKELSSWYFWKDAALHFCHDDLGRPASAAFDLQSGFKGYIPMHEPEGVLFDDYTEELLRCGERAPRGEGSFYRGPIRFLGDETYMVRVDHRSFAAFCFDKNITMAGDSESYRHRREARRLERIYRRDHQNHRPASQWRPPSIEELEAQLAQKEKEYQEWWEKPRS